MRRGRVLRCDRGRHASLARRVRRRRRQRQQLERAPASIDRHGDSTIKTNAGNAGKTITIGSKNFTEEFILGEIYAQALQAAGYKVKKELNLGSEQIAFKALKSGQHRRLPRVHRHRADVVLQGEDRRTSRRTRSRPYDQAQDRLREGGPGRLPPTPFTGANARRHDANRRPTSSGVKTSPT